MRWIAGGRRLVALGMVLALVAVWMPVGAVKAELVSTEEVVQGMRDAALAAEQRARVEAFLGREDVRRQLEALGVEAEEAEARVASLSDAEIEQIAGQIDELPAGQDALSTFFIAAGVVVLVLIITDIAGITNVFTFVR